MTRLATLICAPLFMMAACQSVAQDIGPITRYLSLNPTEEAQNDLRSMSKCISKRHPDMVQLVIRKQDAHVDVENNLIDSSCVPTRMFHRTQFKINSQYYSALAENLLVSDYVASDLPNVTHVTSLEHPALPEVELSRLPDSVRDEFILDRWKHALDLAAECVARAKPSQVFSLAMSKSTSSDELARIPELRQQLDICKVPALSPAPTVFVLRLALSENLYRLFDAARPVIHEKVETGA